jgi:hypothetical protein
MVRIPVSIVGSAFVESIFSPVARHRIFPKVKPLTKSGRKRSG